MKVYERHESPARNGRGLFAAALVEAYPHLPVEEEGWLADPRLRDNFVERVFAYWRLRGLLSGRGTVGDSVRFHTAHKLLLLAHAPEAYRQLGRLVAGARGVSRRDLEQRYVEGLMRALAHPYSLARWPMGSWRTRASRLIIGSMLSASPCCGSCACRC